jgi:hypothetical protein
MANGSVDVGEEEREESRIKGSRDFDSAKRDFQVNLLPEDYLMNSRGLKCSTKIIEQSTARITKGARWESFDLMKVRFSKTMGARSSKAAEPLGRGEYLRRTSRANRCKVLQMPTNSGRRQ